MILAQELQKFVDSIPTISPEKKYWLIRTQSGSLYDNFRDNGFVALEHDEVPLSLITDFSKKFNEDKSKILSAIKKHVTDTHLRLIQPGSDEELNYRKSSLIANQIFKFTFETKKGDIVIIPSAGADLISIGEVMENHIADFTPEQARKIGIESILKKRVIWLKDIKKRDLDPYMYRMFTAHQALNDIGGYADIVERSLHDFFILDGEAHFIINIQKEGEITAPDLFGLGSEILELIDQFADTYKLPVKSSDLAVSINLNSPGKIDLKSKIKITTVLPVFCLPWWVEDTIQKQEIH